MLEIKTFTGGSGHCVILKYRNYIFYEIESSLLNDIFKIFHAC